MSPAGGRPSGAGGLVAAVRWRLLDRRLGRVWARAGAERDLDLLVALRRRGRDVPVTRVTLGASPSMTTAEVVWADGFRLRAGPCHAPAVLAIAAAVDRGAAVTLHRAAGADRLWILDFSADGTVLALLAGSARAVCGGGLASGAPPHPALAA